MKPNKHIQKLHGGYLFPEVRRRVDELLEREPNANVLSLGIGDTTEPLPKSICDALAAYAGKLGTLEGYSGYGPMLGWTVLREAITDRLYKGLIDAEELSISDGAKCDIARLQLLFGHEATIAIPDPSYPAYIDNAVIHAQTGPWKAGLYKKLIYLPTHLQNNFQPNYADAPKTDVIYVCSPNNPTGIVHTHAQLQALVAHAKANRSIIVFDSAYASYIQDPSLPRTIYEIEGAKEVAIEIGSFSKLAGFTGLRLGWAIVPKALEYDDGSSVLVQWTRLLVTVFNGPSNIVQAAGLAVMQDDGYEACLELLQHYIQNARILRQALESSNLEVYGGENAPYLWVHFPGRNSWDVFQEILDSSHLVTGPGIGFGPTGENFLRFAAFGHRNTIEEAAERLTRLFPHEL